MSKIGRKPIDTTGIQVQLNGNQVSIKGPKGTVTHALPEVLTVDLKGNKLVVSCANQTLKNKMLWGLHRVLIANKAAGVKEGFEKELTIVGLGYKGVLTGNKIVFSLGYTDKIDFAVPKDISVEIDKTGQKIKVKGIDKELVGFVSDQIRSLRPPEPYKGTGVLLTGEKIRRKEGKKST